MKTTILKLGAFILLFALMGAGCEKEKKYEDIPLENVKCPCDHDMSFTRKIAIQDILLFDANKTSWNEMKTQTFDGEKSEFISYSKQTKSMIFYLDRSNTLSICNVCNVPEQINDWTIPSAGVVISFYADEFEACSSPPSIGFTQSYGSFVLTSLKRKIE